jgi:hypothetical protein
MKESGFSFWGKRFFWLLAIWLGSILALAVVAYMLRLLMASVGMVVPE